jgi:hypothetical protein
MNRYELSDFIQAEVARIYAKEYQRPFHVVVGNFADCDIISADEKVSVEVKLETTPQRTGNAWIEYWNSSLNCPSGILGTTASLWLHIVPCEGVLTAFEFNKDSLRKLVIEGAGKLSSNSNAKFKVIPLEEFRKYALRTFEFHSAFQDEILYS